jgi:hypothetical protein
MSKLILQQETHRILGACFIAWVKEDYDYD